MSRERASNAGGQRGVQRRRAAAARRAALALRDLDSKSQPHGGQTECRRAPHAGAPPFSEAASLGALSAAGPGTCGTSGGARAWAAHVKTVREDKLRTADIKISGLLGGGGGRTRLEGGRTDGASSVR